MSERETPRNYEELTSEQKAIHDANAPVAKEKPEGYIKDIDQSRAVAEAGARFETARANVERTDRDDTETIEMLRQSADRIENSTSERYETAKKEAAELARDLANDLLNNGIEIKIDRNDKFEDTNTRTMVIKKLDQMFGISGKKIYLDDKTMASIGNIPNLVKYDSMYVLYSFRPYDYEKVKSKNSETEAKS